MDTEKYIQIEVKYHNDQLIPLQEIPNGDWIDLRSAERVVMLAGEHKLISLGISMKLPDGFEAHIVPRSSTFKNFGIIQANHMGVVDNSYCGNNDIWRFSAIAMRDTLINLNDRICQFRIMKKQPSLSFVSVDQLYGQDRGGFGSSGIQ